MAALPSPLPQIPRKPVASQYNWITGAYDRTPEQLELPLPPIEEIVLPDDGSATLLSTENGTQLLVAGFGLFIGKKSERVVIKKGKAVCAQVPLMRIQEIVVGSRGISVSSDLIEELCERGVRMAFLSSSGKPYRPAHLPAADGHGGDAAGAARSAAQRARGGGLPGGGGGGGAQSGGDAG